MICPSCRSADTRTTDSRAIGAIVRRCRACKGCRAEWATTERVDEGSLQVATGSYGPLGVATPSEKGEGGFSGSDLTLIPSGPSEQIREKVKRDGPKWPGFAEWYAEYPSKVGKTDAERAWDRRKPPMPKALETLRWQKKTHKWAVEKIIPNPATWINGGRWDDEPPAKPAPAKPYHAPAPEPTYNRPAPWPAKEVK